MCGIFGVIGGRITAERFLSALDVLEHRGPDDSGTFYIADQGLALGHQRLSIIDLSDQSKQPFHSSCGRYSLIFNGEIYNYIELKTQLSDFYKFKTKSDTEVLLASYVKWGFDCVNHFNGMFSFAIWDRDEQRLFCARDRLGIKPFFYSFSKGVFSFSSEIKALLSLGVDPTANNYTIFNFLYRGLIDYSSETFFKNVQKLNPGCMIVFEKGKLTIKEYWKLEEQILEDQYNHWTDKEVEDNFLSLYADSVALRLRSDVPVGICLSGGLDSNSVRFMAYDKLNAEGVSLFTRTSPRAVVDEGQLISGYLTKNQLDHWHKVEFLPEELRLNDSMIKIQDQPFGSVMTSGMQKVYQLAKDNNVTVLLEGQGSDEILGGYPRFLNFHMLDLVKNKRFLELSRYLGGNQTRRYLKQLAKFKMSSLFSNKKDKDISEYGFQFKQMSADVLSENYVQEFKDLNPKFKTPFKSILRNAQYRDIFYTKLPRMLRYGDHNSMAFSREVRFPFLDHRLVEFCVALPSRFKISPSNQKILLRNVMKKCAMPESIRARKKIGVDLGQDWFKKNYFDEFSDMLNSQTFHQSSFWDLPKLKKKSNDYFEGKTKLPVEMWKVLILEKWFDNIKSF